MQRGLGMLHPGANGPFEMFPPGSYIFFCNLVDKEKDGTVVSHFARGMYVKVEAG